MMIKNLSQIFRRLGMSKYAHEVYEILQKESSIKATDIVARIGESHRPAVYKALKELKDKQLIERVPKGKRFLWKVGRSSRIRELFSEAIQEVHKVVPKDKSKKKSFISSKLQMFKGAEGIRAVFDDVISHTERGHTFYRYTSERDLDAVNAYLSKDYRARRDAKKLERMVISNPLSGKRKKPRLERFIKFIPHESGLFDQNIIELVYGSRVAFIDLNSEESFIFENAPLADFQKTIFRQLYKKL